MITETVRVRIDGEPEPDLVADLLSVDAEEDVDRAGVFALRFAASPAANGRWSHVDDPRLGVWRRISLEIGYGDTVDTVIDGYVTHVEAAFDIDTSAAYVEVSGMDASAAMNLAEKRIAWPDKRDHEIAVEIFRSYGFSAEVQDTVTLHERKGDTVVQADTDIRFLRRLAARNGFECRVRGATGVFRPPNLTEPPQRTLVLSGGADGNLVRCAATVDGTPATLAEIRAIDPVAKKEVTRSLGASPQRSLGAASLTALRTGWPPGRTQVRGETGTSRPEQDARLRQAYGAAERFVTLTGEIDSRAYRSVLRAGRLVTVRGMGESHSGLYYVSRVRHSVADSEYRQTFEAYRNGVGLTGREQFGPPPPALVAAGGPVRTRRSGNRVLPQRQATSVLKGGAPR
ncbi:phage late control D family protein [Solwaraspora sp. WMMB762]|uniref:phage late control D family protein n=1 Tax=Solwaraspora sp. WMMB762 TaxID=3404120 RepID=UPI003B9308AC